MSKKLRYENLLHFKGMYKRTQAKKIHLNIIGIDKIRGTREAINRENTYKFDELVLRKSK